MGRNELVERVRTGIILLRHAQPTDAEAFFQKLLTDPQGRPIKKRPAKPRQVPDPPSGQ